MLIECGKGLAVHAAHVEALAAFGHGPDQESFVGPKVIGGLIFGSFVMDIWAEVGQVKDCRGKDVDGFSTLPGDVAGHGQTLQEDLRPHHLCAHTQHHSALHLSDCLRNNQEVPVAGGPQGRAVTVWVLMNNIVADANVHGDRNPQAVSRGANAHVAVRQCLGLDRVRRLRPGPARRGPGDDDVVELPVSRQRPNWPSAMYRATLSVVLPIKANS